MQEGKNVKYSALILLTFNSCIPTFINMKTVVFTFIILICAQSLFSQVYDSLSFTYQTKDGNPFVAGHGYLPEYGYMDIKLKGKPIWISTIVDNEQIIAVAVLDDGTSQAFQINNGEYDEISDQVVLEKRKHSPPSLLVQEGDVIWIDSDVDSHDFNHPVVLSDGRVVVSLLNGGLLIGNKKININPLPDGRILVDDDDRILLLTDPTPLYGHGVLGDKLEASSFTLIETDPEISIKEIVKISSPGVIEGIKPLWYDLNGDGTREILVTISDRFQGAKLVLFDEQGKLLAESSSIGMGNRWRHQLTIGPIGPEGEIEIVDILTPHIGGPMEFFRWEGSRLSVKSSIRGYTSHVMGSVNLDMSVAGDFNGDGIPEVLVPTFNRRVLGAVQRTIYGSEEVYNLPLGSRLATNLSAFSHPDGDISIAAGLENNTLRIWLPDVEQ